MSLYKVLCFDILVMVWLICYICLRVESIGVLMVACLSKREMAKFNLMEGVLFIRLVCS